MRWIMTDIRWDITWGTYFFLRYGINSTWIDNWTVYSIIENKNVGKKRGEGEGEGALI